jgi:hypothetical protein
MSQAMLVAQVLGGKYARRRWASSSAGREGVQVLGHARRVAPRFSQFGSRKTGGRECWARKVAVSSGRKLSAGGLFGVLLLRLCLRLCLSRGVGV